MSDPSRRPRFVACKTVSVPDVWHWRRSQGGATICGFSPSGDLAANEGPEKQCQTCSDKTGWVTR